MKTEKSVLKNFLGLSVGGFILFIILAGTVYWGFSKDLPEIVSPEDYHPKAVSVVYAPDSVKAGSRVKVGEFYKERRYLKKYDEIPERVVRAFISAEDDQFFEHQGINLLSILRAAFANFKAGQVVQGGSTITQQVAKALLLTPERSFLRKIKEIILSYRIEQNLSKKDILYLYLNEIYLGHGAYGVQAAAEQYFRKDISQVTLGEAALLGGMPQAPGKYSPHLNPKKAKERQQYVLRRMLENRFITPEQHQTALAEELKIYESQDINLKYAPYWIEEVRQYLLAKYGEKKLFEEGLEIELPTSVQNLVAAKKALEDGLKVVDKRAGFRGPLKHLETDDLILKWIDASREVFAKKQAQYRILTTTGTLDSAKAVSRENIEQGRSYLAVVTGSMESGKVVSLSLSGIPVDMASEPSAWARRGNQKNIGQVLRRGDVVLVHVDEVTATQIKVSLDQDPEVQAALYSIDITTGRTLALVGGYSFDESKFNRVTQAKRQPGSSYKPIIFAAGIEKGFTPASVIFDAPIVYEDGETGKWKPTNFEEKFYGDTTFRQALVKSRNVPTIKIVQALTVSKLIEFSKRIGLFADYPQDLSISLGSSILTLSDITRAYSVFPRGGRLVKPILIEQVQSKEGQVLEKAKLDPYKNTNEMNLPPLSESEDGNLGLSGYYPLPQDPDQVMDPRVAYIMSHLMKEVVTYGTGHAAQTLGRISAGKTGTTNDYQDAWYLGFTPEIVTGVWVGYDAQKSIGNSETGARAALPIWLGFMNEAVKAFPPSDFQTPPGIVFSSIHPETGQPMPSNSANSIREAFISGTEPRAKSLTNPKESPSQKGFLKEDF